MSRKRCAGNGRSGALIGPATHDRRCWRLVPRALTPSAFLRALARFGVRPAALPRRARLAWTLGAYAAIAAVCLLDSAFSPVALDRAPELRTAAIFGGIVGVLSILADWIATAAEVTAAYVWIALQWLAGVTAGFLRATGAMFSKVWDGMRIVWSDVLKPALVWIDDHLQRLVKWLKDTFQPVFDFLKEVRCRFNEFYDTFVRPVTDTIDFIRQVNRVLMVFHIDVLNKLDRVLQQVEQRIDEPFIWINQKLNEITNWLNRIVTLDGLFQRITLIKSLASYAPAWIAGFYNTQINAAEVAAKTKAINDARGVTHPPAESGAELSRFYRGESSDIEASVDDAVVAWRLASGLDL